MIFTDYYKAENLPTVKSETRFDVTASTGEYDLFETSLLNKIGQNKGGLSFHLTNRPDKWKNGHKSDKAISRVKNITSLYRPDIESRICYGDIKGTNDACIILYNADFKTAGIHTLEIFIARGLKADRINLYFQFVEGDLQHEVEALQQKAVSKLSK